MSTNEHTSRECAAPLGDEVGSSSRGAGRICVAVSSCSLLLFACTQKLANADDTPAVSSEPTSTTLAAQPALPGGEANADEEGGLAFAEEAELRRGYGAVDMRFNSCVTRTNDYTLRGEACPSGFVIYGPYVAVPAKSEIDVTFEFKPSKRVEVYADIVSRMAAQTLAGLNRQVIEAGVTQKLGYRVYIFNPDVQVESRIGMTADPGTNFEITNLTMTVR